MSEVYHQYWGKASPAPDGQSQPFHLLPCHALDVAACGQALLALPTFSLHPLAQALGWPLAQVQSLCVFFLALHDLGKFARTFQGLAPHLSPDLVPPDESRNYSLRHDSLGWTLWYQDLTAESPVDLVPNATHEFWNHWVRSVVGHHGKPPQESESNNLIAQDVAEHFLRADRRAARQFACDAATLLLPPDLPSPTREHTAILKRHTWRLAGLAVLADWLGSNQAFFPYRSTPLPLAEYWPTAQQQAAQAVAAAGLRSQPVREWPAPLALFDHLRKPSPLQQYAATTALENGPQLFLLEDVTGAGKTEAALILAQRLMQAGHAHGLYFALPSMATANQMYQRAGAVYQRLYAPGGQPSLILAHGARELVHGFRQSVLQAQAQADDCNYQPDDPSATTQCNAWLADSRKKALLAEAGVGTLDQALLAILPARHQSLRLLGLAGKVLIVDEVHSYDAYLVSLLQTLLRAHARQGGSVILLSATLPLAVRQSLLDAYRQGLGADEGAAFDDRRYPLATRAGQALQSHACATRPQVRRRVQVRALHDEAEALNLIAQQAQAGRCVCWIRNTVDDARRAHALLAETRPAHSLILFHSRFAMGDRLDIEDRVLARLGKHSGAAERAGMVLIGTQVLEQSLDFDADVMVSDLAPIDLLIQRAGRLQRHARQANGDLAADGVERREPPVLYLLTPDPVDVPDAHWYAGMFPKGCFVYPNAGQLWLGARALLQAGCIETPGESGQPGAVRDLMEAVYDTDLDAIPHALQKASQDQMGQDLAMQSQARFNALQLDKGYCMDSSVLWYEEHQVPTRLGDETLTLYLATWRDGELHPLCQAGAHRWEQSAIRIAARHARNLAPEWQQRFTPALQRLRSHHRLLQEPAFVLPLVDTEGQWIAKVLNAREQVLEMRYDQTLGLVW